jgi:hypothetical protein
VAAPLRKAARRHFGKAPRMRGSIQGYVVRGDRGTPISGATVSIAYDAGATAKDEKPGLHDQTTNSAGWFAFDELREGSWVVHARTPEGGRGEAQAPVFDNAVSEVRIELNGLHRWIATLDSDDRMSDVSSADEACGGSRGGGQRMPTGGVQGRVVYAGDGAPVDGATIGIVRGAGPAPDIAPLTDASGRFALDGLPPGAWVLSAIGPDGAEGSAEVRVTGNSIADVVIRISRKTR